MLGVESIANFTTTDSFNGCRAATEAFNVKERSALLLVYFFVIIVSVYNRFVQLSKKAYHRWRIPS